MNKESRYHIPFFDASKQVLERYGIIDIQKQDVELNKALTMNYEVNMVVGITGDIRGSVGMSMPYESATKVASKILQGDATEKGKLNQKAKDALGSLLRDAALLGIDKVAAKGKDVEASPPTLVVGQELHIVISLVHTVSLHVSSSEGLIQINVCLEGVH